MSSATGPTLLYCDSCRNLFGSQMCLSLRLLIPQKLLFWRPLHPCYTGSNPLIGGSQWFLGFAVTPISINYLVLVLPSLIVRNYVQVFLLDLGCSPTQQHQQQLTLNTKIISWLVNLTPPWRTPPKKRVKGLSNWFPLIRPFIKPLFFLGGTLRGG